MGGFAEALGGMFRKGGAELGESLEKSEPGRQLLSLVGSQRYEFSRSAEGMRILPMIEKYDQVRDQYLGQMKKPLENITSAVKGDKNLVGAPLADIHQHLQSTSHPARLDAAAVLQHDPTAANKTLLEHATKLSGQASLLAHTQVFGAHNENMVDEIISLYDSGEEWKKTHANTLLDILANHFHDTTSINKAPASSTKLDVLKYANLLNKVRGIENEPEIDLSKFNTANVYEHTNTIERLASKRARMFLAPMIAINHMSTFFNMAWAPLTAMGRTMMDYSNEDIKNLADASGIFASQMHRELIAELEARTGFIASHTNPLAGSIVDKVFHNPGFNMVRKLQLRTAGVLGYHSTMYWAEAATHGDKRAILELKEMGLDPVAIAKRGGKLSEDELKKGMYEFVNNRLFLSKRLDRSLTATRNPWTRMLTMFHGYVTNQQAFMRRELQKMLDAGDVAGIARYAGTVGVLFPMVAPIIKSAEVLARTASIHQVKKSITDDYDAATSGDPSKMLGEYLDLLSYFGSFGTMHGFIQASHSDRLALALMGPIAGSIVRTGQDVINLSTKSTKTGKRNPKPLEKDILQQTVPGLGTMVSHQLFDKD